MMVTLSSGPTTFLHSKSPDGGWRECEKAAQLAIGLPVMAQPVLSELSHDTLSNYEMLKTVLMQRFFPSERETSYRCEFRNRRRQLDETMTDYGYALKRLGRRAFPSIPLHQRERLIVEQYNSELGDADIKRHTQFKHGQTLAVAISLAKGHRKNANNGIFTHPV